MVNFPFLYSNFQGSSVRLSIRYSRKSLKIPNGYLKPEIAEGQTTQWPTEKGQENKQWPTEKGQENKQ